MKGFVIWLCGFLLVPGALGADLRPIARPAGEAVRLVEGTWSCNAGYGAEQDRFALFNQNLGPASPLDPSQGVAQAGSLGLGCVAPWFYVSYRFIDRSLGLPAGSQVAGQAYDHMSLRLDQLALGGSLTLLPHRLALDVGLQNYILSYRLGLFPQNSAEVVRSEVMKDSGVMLHSRLRWYTNAFFFISYELAQNLDPKGVLRSSARLGAQMTVRY